jgi:hypothetical protein
MKIGICIALLLCSLTAFAQAPPTNVPSGQLSFTALSGPFGSAGVDIFGTYGVSTYGELREDNFMFPAANGTFFGGGYQYALDKYVCPLVVNSNLNCNKFSTYVNGNIGVGRTTVGSNANNAIGGGFGTGINWDPSGKGQFTVNLLDFHYEHFAFGTVKGWTPIAAVGISLGFGNNAPATAAKLERFHVQQAKRLKKMQDKARKSDERVAKAARG